MFQLIDFSSWIEYIEAPEGSGASEKVWLVNKNDNHKGLFKYPKIMTNGEITGEYWAEKLASHIGDLLNIECAKVDI